MFNGNKIPSPYTIMSQSPLDSKGYFLDVNDLINISNFRPLEWYNNMKVIDMSTGVEYVWEESVIGLITDGYTYPDNVVSFGIVYSLKTFNFVPYKNKISNVSDSSIPKWDSLTNKFINSIITETINGIIVNGSVFANGGNSNIWNNAEPSFLKNTAFNKDFGTTADTLIHGNDIRLSDTRAPKSHTHDWVDIINNPSTILGYGITDSYNKTEVDSLVNPKANLVGGNTFTGVQKLDGTIDILSDGLTGFTDSRVILHSSSNAKGAGIFSRGLTHEWFWGNPYGSHDNTFTINRAVAGTGDAVANMSNSLFSLNNLGSTTQLGGATFGGDVIMSSILKVTTSNAFLALSSDISSHVVSMMDSSAHADSGGLAIKTGDINNDENALYILNHLDSPVFKIRGLSGTIESLAGANFAESLTIRSTVGENLLLSNINNASLKLSRTGASPGNATITLANGGILTTDSDFYNSTKIAGVDKFKVDVLHTTVFNDFNVNGNSIFSNNITVQGASVGYILKETDAANQRWQMTSIGGQFRLRDITGGTYPIYVDKATPSGTLQLKSDGSVTVNKLVSTVAAGIPPLTVASNTKVVNLNADLLDGTDATQFASTNINPLTDMDATKRQGLYRFDPHATNPTNTPYAGIVYGNNGNVTSQLASQIGTGESYVRSFNATWSPWRKLYDDVNFGKPQIDALGIDAATLGGIGSSGFFKTSGGAPQTVIGDVTFTNQINTPYIALPISANTISWNLNNPKSKIEIGASVSLAVSSPTNIKDGGSYTLRIRSANAKTIAVTWGTSFQGATQIPLPSNLTFLTGEVKYFFFQGLNSWSINLINTRTGFIDNSY